MENLTFRRFFHGIRKRGKSHFSSGTPYYELSHLLGIKVQKYISCHEPLFKSVRTDETLLFIYCEEAFNRSVHKILVEQHSHSCRASHAIVGTECRAFSPYPFSVNNRFDGIRKKVMFHTGTLFGNHILMTLKYDHWRILVTRRSRLLHHHIADTVAMCLYAMTFSPIYQKLTHLVEMMRRTWHFCYFIETFPDQSGFKISDFHNYSCFLNLA
ncbi:hypothetical protein IMSAGC016_01488 [Muribaculaceae bacterium]|nr:hypothetical protein IMSAGC016_01488 [Muribaculaceae bacterium]